MIKEPLPDEKMIWGDSWNGVTTERFFLNGLEQFISPRAIESPCGSGTELAVSVERSGSIFVEWLNGVEHWRV